MSLLPSDNINLEKIFCKYCKIALNKSHEVFSGYHLSCKEEFDLLENYSELKEFFSRCYIVDFDKTPLCTYSIEQLENLSTLSIRHKHVSEIPLSISLLQSLVNLDISWNELSSIPEFVFKLPNLRFLNISHNHLNLISPLIAKLPQLVSLDLSYNDLSEFPDSMGSLLNLQSLSLNSNRIAIVPSILGKLKSLISLDVSDNKLFDLPELIFSLQNLLVFSASQNMLQSI